MYLTQISKKVLYIIMLAHNKGPQTSIVLRHSVLV